MINVRSRLAKSLRRLARWIDPDPMGSLYVGNELKIGPVTVTVGEAVDETTVRISGDYFDIIGQPPERPIETVVKYKDDPE